MRTLKNKFAALCLLAILFISCQKEDATPVQISPQAKAYLEEVLNIMQMNSINKYIIDWASFRHEVFNTAAEAQTIGDTYRAITKALIMLSDNHSTFSTPFGGYTIYASASLPPLQLEAIATPSVPKEVGYVKITSFSGDAESSINFAKQIQNEIARQDHLGLKGWIVDLRNNTGGNMWPMLAGIGPILGEGLAGYFIDPDGRETPWGFQNGASELNGNPVTRLSNPYQLLVPNQKVAVLLNSAVASSGEIVAVGFKGRENTKSFGSVTRGLTTCNSQFWLSDYAVLNLTTANIADRTKEVITRKFSNALNIWLFYIEPDVKSSNETIINDAISWIID